MERTTCSSSVGQGVESTICLDLCSLYVAAFLSGVFSSSSRCSPDDLLEQHNLALSVVKGAYEDITLDRYSVWSEVSEGIIDLVNSNIDDGKSEELIILFLFSVSKLLSMTPISISSPHKWFKMSRYIRKRIQEQTLDVLIRGMKSSKYPCYLIMIYYVVILMDFCRDKSEYMLLCENANSYALMILSHTANTQYKNPKWSHDLKNKESPEWFIPAIQLILKLLMAVVGNDPINIDLNEVALRMSLRDLLHSYFLLQSSRAPNISCEEKCSPTNENDEFDDRGLLFRRPVDLSRTLYKKPMTRPEPPLSPKTMWSWNSYRAAGGPISNGRINPVPERRPITSLEETAENNNNNNFMSPAIGGIVSGGNVMSPVPLLNLSLIGNTNTEGLSIPNKLDESISRYSSVSGRTSEDTTYRDFDGGGNNSNRPMIPRLALGDITKTNQGTSSNRVLSAGLSHRAPRGGQDYPPLSSCTTDRSTSRLDLSSRPNVYSAGSLHSRQDLMSVSASQRTAKTWQNGAGGIVDNLRCDATEKQLIADQSRQIHNLELKIAQLMEQNQLMIDLLCCRKSGSSVGSND